MFIFLNSTKQDEELIQDTNKFSEGTFQYDLKQNWFFMKKNMGNIYKSTGFYKNYMFCLNLNKGMGH